MTKQKQRAKERKLRYARAWVPVRPDGVVMWHLSWNAREGVTTVLCGDGIDQAKRWSQLRRSGWRIVRCRVEE
jgi:hypothetical protein